jgi:hypothetical protein
VARCSIIIFLICAGNTTTEPQGNGRKRGHGDGEGADSEPGKCSYPLVLAALSPPSLITCLSQHDIVCTCSLNTSVDL